ncbi:MAG: sulfatase-like hydrolase/transferase [Bryobacteraceae bacterium]
MKEQPTRREWVSGAVAAVGAPYLGKATTQTRRPNILFLMTDQHRADCVGAYGNPVIRTPNIDRIAREGVLFRNAYSSTPTCTPARSALLTGLSPWHHGMLGYGEVAAHYQNEMPRLLRETGYQTMMVGKTHWVRSGMATDFTRWSWTSTVRVATIRCWSRAFAMSHRMDFGAIMRAGFGAWLQGSTRTRRASAGMITADDHQSSPSSCTRRAGQAKLLLDS